MIVKIDKNGKTPVYIQIFEQIKKMIYGGVLVDGYTLPSERTLAKDLGVHRNTVVRAYSELKAEGIISAYQGQGYRVSFGNMFYGMVKKPINWKALIKEEYVDIESDFDDVFSKAYETNLISFGGGMASGEIYPPEEIADVFESVLKKQRDNAYFYTTYQGDRELRQEIANFMRKKGIDATARNVQIFSQSNQCLEFIMTLMLKEGDKVIAGELLSPDVYRTVALAGGQLITVPSDEEGIMCQRLEGMLEKEKPKFIYIESGYQNPTGISISLERRKKLLELSYKYRIPIIEEDESSELYYEDSRIVSIKSLDTGNNVIYIYSFSLTMTPGGSISFVVADKSIIDRMSNMVSVRMVNLDWFPQMITLQYMKNGLFHKRLDEFRDLYREKRNVMCDCLKKISKKCDIQYRVPTGGIYMWVKLATGVSGRRLLAEAQKKGLTFMPGYIFHPSGKLGNEHVRLTYSYPTVEEIAEGVKIFEDVLLECNRKF